MSKLEQKIVMEYVGEFVNGAKNVFVRIEFIDAVFSCCETLGIRLGYGALSEDNTMKVLYVW